MDTEHQDRQTALPHRSLIPALLRLQREKNITLCVILSAFLLRQFYAAYNTASPIVTGDEFYVLSTGLFYNDLDRLFSENRYVVHLGSSIYFYLIYLFSSLGKGIESFLKAINVLTLFGALFLIAASLARGCSKYFLLGTLVMAFSPANLYSTYIMPDAVYYGAFLLLIATLFLLVNANQAAGLLGMWTLLGVGIGILTLLKPHGLFLLIAACGTTIAVGACFVAPGDRLRTLGMLSLALLLSFAVTTLAVKQVVSPPSGSTLGQYYAGFISSELSELFSVDRIMAVVHLASLHILAVTVLIGPAILFLIAYAAKGGDLGRRALCVFVLFGFVAIIGAIALLFSRPPLMLQNRYLGFLYTSALLVIVWLAPSAREDPREVFTNRWRAAAAALWLVSAIAFLLIGPSLRLLPAYVPELFFAYDDYEFGPLNVLGRNGLQIGVALICIGAALILVSRVHWLRVQLSVVAVLFALSNVNVGRWQKAYGDHLNFFKDAGDLVRLVCRPSEGEIIALAAPSGGSVHYLALFRIFDRPARIVTLHDLNPKAINSALGQARCVLSYDLHVEDSRYELLRDIGGYRVYRRLDLPAS